jgi:predicted TIM-barrel fold metal-dependent hydrolase
VFGEVLARHPDLTAVVAHLGMPEYVEFLDLADRYPRVHLDTTMAFTDFAEARTPFPKEMRPRLLDLRERIVFGSDFPNTPYAYAHQVESLLRLELGDDWLRGVLHDNAQRVLEK